MSDGLSPKMHHQFSLFTSPWFRHGIVNSISTLQKYNWSDGPKLYLVLCYGRFCRCFFYGDVSPKSNPLMYGEHVAGLVNYFREKYFVNSTSIIPLVINTHGWVKGNSNSNSSSVHLIMVNYQTRVGPKCLEGLVFVVHGNSCLSVFCHFSQVLVMMLSSTSWILPLQHTLYKCWPTPRRRICHVTSSGTKWVPPKPYS